MVLRSDGLQGNLQHLNGMLTTHEAAKQLDLSYWHFMHLVEAGRIPGVRIVDRWLFSPGDLDDYRRSKYGELEDLANNERPSDIARKLQQSRQAVHSQISLIREKVLRAQQTPIPPDGMISARRNTRNKRASLSLPIEGNA